MIKAYRDYWMGLLTKARTNVAGYWFAVPIFSNFHFIVYSGNIRRLVTE